MEEVEGLFSSPEKSPARLNGFDDYDEGAENGDSLGSEMSMDEGVCDWCLRRCLANWLLTPSVRSARQRAWPHGLSQSSERCTRLFPGSASTVAREALSPQVSCLAILSRTGG